jgi:hypothetical protein
MMKDLRQKLEENNKTLQSMRGDLSIQKDQYESEIKKCRLELSELVSKLDKSERECLTVNTNSQNFEQLLNAGKSETIILQENLQKSKLEKSEKDV